MKIFYRTQNHLKICYSLLNKVEIWKEEMQMTKIIIDGCRDANHKANLGFYKFVSFAIFTVTFRF